MFTVDVKQQNNKQQPKLQVFLNKNTCSFGIREKLHLVCTELSWENYHQAYFIYEIALDQNNKYM